MPIDYRKIDRLIKRALAEDIGRGDITTRLCIPKDLKVKAEIIFEENAIVCGLKVAERIFKTVDRKIGFKNFFTDGARIRANRVAAELIGSARSILTAERTALNFLGHLSGIATQTSRFVRRTGPYPVKIMDTRKTLPGLRYLQKYAVRIGGGQNHRMGLYDQILIKDNHLSAIGYKPPLDLVRLYSSQLARNKKVTDLGDLIRMLKKKRPKGLKIEIEVKNLREFKQALEAGPDIIMLDNMRLKDIKKAVGVRKIFNRKKRRPLLEVSGNISLESVSQIAGTGVDMISAGSLTHSARAINLSLHFPD
jgi:nicotinate-nucleotide pyrophosphorylase (carboxylating)